MANGTIGIVLIVVGVALIAFTFRKPARKGNNPLAADYQGVLGGILLVIIGLLMIFNGG